ncbi:MAG: hypothetical protein EXR76_16710, partial [Myxococcales bacterium]|nr:hypothetical protein [Myxococcales bacterium]
MTHRLFGFAVWVAACTTANPDRLSQNRTGDGGPLADVGVPGDDLEPRGGAGGSDRPTPPDPDDGVPPADLGVVEGDGAGPVDKDVVLIDGQSPADGGPVDGGPVDGGPVDGPNAVECAAGAVDGMQCGLNFRGDQRRTCDEGGRWSDFGRCVEEDVCVDDLLESRACGVNGRGEQVRACVVGQWSAYTPCDDPDRECEDGTEESDNCGLNGRGLTTHICADGRFGPFSECLDEDVCVDGAVDSQGCGLNQRGARDRRCVGGHFGAFAACVDPDVCLDGAVVSEMACGLNRRGLRQEVCEAGQVRPLDCVDDDVCVDGTIESRECGLNRRQSRTCANGQFGVFSECVGVVPPNLCDVVPNAPVGDTIGQIHRTEDLQNSCFANEVSEVVYAFQAEVAGLYTARIIDAPLSFSLAVRVLCDVAASELDCAAPGNAAVINFASAAGQTYFIVVEGAGDLGDFTLRIELSPLGGTSCDLPIPAVEGVQHGATAGEDNLRPDCVDARGPEQILLFTAPRTGIWRFRTAGTVWDTVLSLRSVCNDVNAELSCNDDVSHNIDNSSAVLAPLSAGEAVYVIVDGYHDEDGGRYTLTIDEIEPLRDGTAMVAIDAGLFLRGSVDPARPPSERPQRQIFVSAFELDTLEVTVSAYAGCVSAGRCTPPGDGDDCTWDDREGHPNLPANCLTWGQAKNFCGQVGKRLPTEAEWEKAARGGCEARSTPECVVADDAFPYPWGNGAPTCDRAVMSECNGDDALDVGTTNPGGNSVYGLVDMAGNAPEAVLDCYSDRYYDASP